MTKKTETPKPMSKWAANVALANGILLLIGTTLNLITQISPTIGRIAQWVAIVLRSLLDIG